MIDILGLENKKRGGGTVMPLVKPLHLLSAQTKQIAQL